MPSLNVFLIHSPHLTTRESTLTTTCKLLEAACQEVGYRFRIFKIQGHSPMELKQQTQQLEKRIQYEKTQDEEFDRLIQTLNLEQTSNYLKHQEALKQIVHLSSLPTLTSEDLYMVMEDDAMILPEFHTNLKRFLQLVQPSEWDFISLSVSSPSSTGKDEEPLLTDLRSISKILPGKEAYFINPKTAASLLDYLETIRFSFRFQLSYWLHTHQEIRAMCPIRRITLEGSKVGFMPSSTTENNLLVYNQEFMEIFKMMIQQIPYDFQKIKQCYKIIEHLKSPEAIHLYGVVLHKEGKMEQAKEMFLTAVQEMTQKQGLISARSELLNNAINIHGLAQEDLEKYQALESKFLKVVF